MNVLDCTLRDGGYYNKWDFDSELVKKYLSAMSGSGVSYVELGLRNFPQEEFLGPFAYTSEVYLDSIYLPDGVRYGVMVDAKTILNSSLSIEEAVGNLFSEKAASKISLVRIAAHFHEVVDSKEIAFLLKEKGYTVGFNLMQSGGKESEEIASKAAEILSWNAVDVLYFADSLGNMDGDEVKRIITALRSVWPHDLGIHTHDNMGRGLDNSLVALDNGVKWLDSTVTGMGRGAGNTQTENLLAVLSAKNKYLDPSKIFELVIQDFEPMQKAYGWGSNLLYFLGAQNNVHPTYIQNLLSDTHVGTKEIVGAIKYLMSQDGTNKYDGKVLEAALSLTDESVAPCGEDIRGIFDGRDVLLVTNAPSVGRHKHAIELFIKEKKPIVIGINIARVLEQEYFDYCCISHNFKFLSDSKDYGLLSRPLILPKHRFKAEELAEFCENEVILDYGFSVEQEVLSFTPTFAVAPYDLTAVYALSVAFAGGAKKIYLAGFDGYESGDERQSEMIHVFQMAAASESYKYGKNIVSITPTTYPVIKSSVYAEL